MTAGRPPIFGKEILKKAKEYLEKLPRGEVIHTVEGLALYLRTSRRVLYDWSRKGEDTEDEEHKPTPEQKEFLHIMEELMTRQAQSLMSKGLKGTFNPMITKLILGKHGYSDKQELMGRDGEAINLGVVLLPQKKNENTLEAPTKAGDSPGSN